ncbi:MAG: 2-oxoacid:acceptor oxidoreductase subunit alpha [Chloroflexota bacterium]
MQGNEAVAEGALAAGCRFYGGYPITPSSEVAEILSRRLPKVGGVFIQMEDEIASIAAIIGASLGGLKSATATSGPGFSLMQENIGFAVCTEVPCVIVNVQRTGPSTGLPTSPAQGDVMQARWGTHGDHPIIALSASSVRECFDVTVRAFNLSEKYRIPVILLLDEVIAHLREKVVLPAPGTYEIIDRAQPTVPPEWYFPYEETPTDVPPMASFGEGYRYHVTGLLHDKAGFPTLRLDEINPWIERLFRKIDSNLDDIVRYEQFMMGDAEVALVSYGASARSAQAAMRVARQAGRRVGLVRLQTIWPFPQDLIKRVAGRVKLIVVPEMNLGQIILEVERVACGQAEIRGVNRADGEIVTPQKILEALEV